MIKKKIMSTLLVLIFVLTMMTPILGSQALAANATSGNCGNGDDSVSWSYANNTLTISGDGEMYNYWDNSKPAYHAWSSGIQTVKILSGVSSISKNAFYGLGAATSVSIADTVESIGVSAFSKCSSLRSVSIPGSVYTIDSSAFQNCSKLLSVTLGSGVTELGYYCFSGCTSLTSLTLPESVATLENYAFSDCTSLSSVSIYNDDIYIRSDTFKNIASNATFHCNPGSNAEAYADKHGFNCAYFGSDTSNNIPATFTVTFNANGGSVSPDSITVTDGDNYGTLPTPTRSGYTFEGWYTAVSGGTKVTASTIVSLSAKQVLYAHWTASSAGSVFLDVSDDADYAEAIEYVIDIGVMVGYSDGNFYPDKTVTRAEMATIICRLLNDTDNLTKDGTTFFDVPESHWANRYIEKAVSLGIIAGYGNGEFGPSDNVTYEQAITMIIRAIDGGAEKARKAGGYPDGFLAVAYENELLEGVMAEKGEPFSRANTAIILFNCKNYTFVS